VLVLALCLVNVYDVDDNDDDDDDDNDDDNDDEDSTSSQSSHARLRCPRAVGPLNADAQPLARGAVAGQGVYWVRTTNLPRGFQHCRISY